MPIEQRPQKVIADQLHDLANRVSDMETATDATQQADHYADMAAEISHRLETLQGELARELELYGTYPAPWLARHRATLTEMLERSKVSDPPTPQLRDPDDAPSAFKIAAQPDVRKDSWPAEGGPLDGTNITTEWINDLVLVDRPPTEPNDGVAMFRSTYQRWHTAPGRFVWRFISTRPFDCYGCPIEK
jgi:hypothetical protein